jgi:predicted permease
MLCRHPGLSLASVVTFGLGIGLTTAIFSIVNGALFKGLPFEDADRVLWVESRDLSGNNQGLNTTLHDFLDIREQQTAFEGLCAVAIRTVNLSGEEGRPERHTGLFTSVGLFEALRVTPLFGRAFAEGEDSPGADPVLLIGYDIWQDRFGGTPDILGRTVWANGVQRSIVGVMPEGFRFPDREQVWLPLELDPTAAQRGEDRSYGLVGRLAEGVSLDEAAAQLSAIAARLEQAYPESNENIGVAVRTFTDLLGDDMNALLLTMLGAVLGVLMIASVNVANLLLARASVRTREMAVRTALGAGRVRVVLQLLMEVLVLAVAGALLGAVLGYVGIEAFDAITIDEPPPFWITFEPDFRVMLFVMAVTAFSAIFAGVFPALQASRADVGETLRDQSRGSSSLRLSKVTGALVITEVALSCGLLIAAGLMIKSVVGLKTVDLAFATDNVFTARVNLPPLEYPDTASRVLLYEELLPRLEAIPGVEAATISDGLPASGNGTRVFQIEGRSYGADEDFPVAREGVVTPGYFRTFEADVLQGRVFSSTDRRGSLPVVVVNETFMRSFFPDGDVLAQRIRMGRRDTSADWLTIVGVVPDMKMEGINNRQASPAGFYVPIAQGFVGTFASIAVRTNGNPMIITSDVRDAVAAVDPNLPIYDVMSMDGVIGKQTWTLGVFGWVFMVLGVAALLLAAIGLYGVMSFAVAQRTQEMGVRMALGSPGTQLIGLVMRRGLVHLTIGLGLGLCIGVIAAGPLQMVLFEIDARDPSVFGMVVTTLAATGVLASAIPARRVTRVDPVTALTPE